MAPLPAPDAPPLIGRGLRPGGSVDLDFDPDVPPSQPLMPKLQNIDAILAKVIIFQDFVQLPDKVPCSYSERLHLWPPVFACKRWL